MALRWRATGELYCAAKVKERSDDTYIDDRLHYQLSVVERVILPASDEKKTGRWFWINEVIRDNDRD